MKTKISKADARWLRGSNKQAEKCEAEWLAAIIPGFKHPWKWGLKGLLLEGEHPDYYTCKRCGTKKLDRRIHAINCPGCNKELDKRTEKQKAEDFVTSGPNSHPGFFD